MISGFKTNMQKLQEKNQRYQQKMDIIRQMASRSTTSNVRLPSISQLQSNNQTIQEGQVIRISKKSIRAEFKNMQKIGENAINLHKSHRDYIMKLQRADELLKECLQNMKKNEVQHNIDRGQERRNVALQRAQQVYQETLQWADEHRTNRYNCIDQESKAGIWKIIKILGQLKESEYDKNGSDTCAICFEEFTEFEKTVKTGKCIHQYHKQCIFMWFRKKANCPVCKVELDGKKQE